MAFAIAPVVRVMFRVYCLTVSTWNPSVSINFCGFPCKDFLARNSISPVNPLLVALRDRVESGVELRYGHALRRSRRSGVHFAIEINLIGEYKRKFDMFRVYNIEVLF